MKSFKIAFITLLFFLFVQETQAQCTLTVSKTDVTTNGGTDGSATAQVNVASTYQCSAPVTSTETSASCTQTISTSSDIVVAAGAKYCITSSNFINGITLNGGTVVIYGQATPSFLTFNSGTIIVLGTANFSNLSINSNGSNLYNYGTANVSNGLTVYGNLYNHGDFNLNTGNLSVSSSGTLTNTKNLNVVVGSLTNYNAITNGGTLYVKTDFNNNSPATFTNNCRFNIDGSYINNGLFNNYGSIKIPAGTMTINGGSTFKSYAGSEVNTLNLLLSGSSTVSGLGSGCSLIKVSANTTLQYGVNLSGTISICDANGVESNGTSTATSFFNCTCPGSSSNSGCTYAWLSGTTTFATTSSVANLAAGTYTVNVTCPGCSTITQQVIILQPTASGDSYVSLKHTLDGNYYLVSDSKLRFRFEEEYSIPAGSTLAYRVYDDQRAQVALASLNASIGDNRFDLNVSSLTSGKYYTLEVLNSKKEKWVLRFKIK